MEISHLVNWLATNKEWLFSGIGVVLLFTLGPKFFSFVKLLIFPRVSFYDIGRHFPLFFQRKPSSNQVSNLVRDIICDTQGDYIQFIHTAGELHREIIRALGEEDSARLLQAHDALIKHVNSGIFNAAIMQFGRLQEYFNGRHAIKPRCCLKMVKQEAGSIEKYVYAHARDDMPPKNKEYKTEYPIHSHSIFKDIEVDGKGKVINILGMWKIG